jgi:Kef-type K+ transport system membrane component KefB
MDAPGNTTRTSRLRTVLRRLVLGAFVCVVVLIVLLVGAAVLSVTGLSFDPHGYGMFAGILFAAVLLPVALMLWVLYRSMRRSGN